MKIALGCVWLTGLALLSGCASVFSDETSGPAAKLRLMAREPAVTTWIHTYEKTDCQNPQFMGAFGVPHGRPQERSPKGMIGGARSPQPNVVERVVPAKPTTILFTQFGPHSSGVARSCSLAVSFRANPDFEYEISYGYDDKVCFADVNRLSLVDGRVVREPVLDAQKNLGKCIPFAN